MYNTTHNIESSFKEHNLYFINRHAMSHIHDILKDTMPKNGRISFGQHALYHSKPNLVMMSYSDVLEDLSRYEYGPFRTFAIDAALLKACKPILNDSQKNVILEKYGLKNNNKPIVVIGRIGYDENGKHQEIIKELLPYAKIITVAHGDTGLKKYYLPKLTSKEKDQVLDVEGRGKLADLYTISDLNISGYNLQRWNCQLTNFFEQTQNGPVMMVLPSFTKQYGFQTFLDEKMVMPCENVEEIIVKSKNYLKNFNSDIKSKYIKKRTKFTTNTLNIEMPKILSTLEYVLNSGNEIELFKYTHPESDWKVNDYQSKEYIETYNRDLEAFNLTLESKPSSSKEPIYSNS
jgi:hypothetical protein